jgi:Na+:H+ antiporter, NhaA family
MSTLDQRSEGGALRFFQHEAAGGVLLLVAAIAALAIANSPLAWLYGGFIDTRFSIRLGALGLDKPLLLWINDGLMALFFLLVGLEIKRELLVGELSSFGRAVLPAAAAAGGMLVPALIYVMVNRNNPAGLQGWAIPCATDIAFAVGVLALLGPRIPGSLKIFLLALAIIDDLGAIIIIAAFYTSDLHGAALALAVAGAALLALLNATGVQRAAPYALVGVFMWICVLKSGVHATLTGVVVAFAIPLRGGAADSPSLLEQIEHNFHPWIVYGVLPLFAFANAGVSFSGFSFATLLEPIPLGIFLGLVVGKPVGVLLATWVTVRSGLAPAPEGTTWRQILGVGLLAGIGFTMSLFIGTLAFETALQESQLRLGVLAASLVAATAGYLVLRR